MSEINTRADSVRRYLTGAGSNGGAQTDPTASLGNYRSSTRVGGLGVTRTSAISNITIDYASRKNGVGNGTLTAPTSNTLTWTPPGGTAGPAVTILNGETKILEGGGTGGASKYIQVSRTSTANLTGTETDALAIAYNGVIGMANAASSEAAIGSTKYRGEMLLNGNSVDVGILKVFVGTLGTRQTSDSAQLGATGSGTITTTGSFSTWPNSGFARIQQSGGTLREIVYYTSRTSTSLTISRAITTAVFTGTGLDDLSSGGTYSGGPQTNIIVEIDGEGTPDTFQWSLDGGSTWEDTTVAITGSAQTLQEGITITFAATTGHDSGDQWAFVAHSGRAQLGTTAGAGSSSDTVDTVPGIRLAIESVSSNHIQTIGDEDTEPTGRSWSTGITGATGLSIGTLAASGLYGLWIERTVPYGAVAEPSVENLVEYTFDAA